MLNREQNDRVTRTDRGTPGGDLLRRYWQPVALSRELSDETPLPVDVMGEELVLFRDEKGAPQLIGRACPHRAVDLSYGRVENGGLRCIYHGWLLSGTGRCLEQPGEPDGSAFKSKICHPAYPCRDVGGMIFAYLGDGDAPRLPNFPFMSAPLENTFAIKVLQECNYLQANEGNIDPQHLSYLHRFISQQGLDSPELNALISNEPAPSRGLITQGNLASPLSTEFISLAGSNVSVEIVGMLASSRNAASLSLSLQSDVASALHPTRRVRVDAVLTRSVRMP